MRAKIIFFLFLFLTQLYPIVAQPPSTNGAKTAAVVVYKIDSIAYETIGEGSQSVNRSISTLTYDDSNRHISSFSKSYNANNELLITFKNELTYTAEGRIYESSNYRSVQNNPLTPTSKKTYHYDEQGRIVEQIESISTDDQTWALHSKTRYTYDEEGREKDKMTYSFDAASQTWIETGETIFYHDATADRIVLQEDYNILLGSRTLNGKLEYSYNDEERSYSTTYSFVNFNSGEWTLHWRNEFRLNENNQIIEQNQFRLSPSEVFVLQDLFEYDENNNLVRYTRTHGPDSNLFTDDFKEEYEFDVTTSAENIFIPNSLQDLEVMTTSQNKCVSIRRYNRANAQEPWPDHYSITKFYYSNYSYIAELLLNERYLYPNPTNSILNTLYPANTKFQLFNTLGQMVFETITTVDNEILNLPPMVTGTYIYRSTIDEGRVVVR
jgi:hypothetical protein